MSLSNPAWVGASVAAREAVADGAGGCVGVEAAWPTDVAIESVDGGGAAQAARKNRARIAMMWRRLSNVSSGNREIIAVSGSYISSRWVF
jgi:hypothetical protein